MDTPPTALPVAAAECPAAGATLQAPALFAADHATQKRFWEFSTATIRNRNTRLAYLRAPARFGDWCSDRGVVLKDGKPMIVAAYIEELTRALAPASVKQHLASIRMLFDWLVLGHVIPFDPAASVRGPKHVVRTGKTSVRSADGDMRSARRDRHLEHRGPARPCPDRVMVYGFARVSAAVAMRVGDYYTQGRRSFFRRRAGATMPCRRTTWRRSIWTPTWRPPGSATIWPGPCSGPAAPAGSHEPSPGRE